MVARGVEGDHLLHVHGNLLLDLEGEHLVYIVLHLVEPTVDVELPELSIDAGAGRFGDIYVRLAGSRLEGDDLGAERPGRDRIKVAAFELPVAGDASVYDPAIQRRDHLHLARPVLRGDLPLHGRLVHAGYSRRGRRFPDSSPHRPPPTPAPRACRSIRCRWRSTLRADPPPWDRRSRRRASSSIRWSLSSPQACLLLLKRSLTVVSVQAYPRIVPPPARLGGRSRRPRPPDKLPGSRYPARSPDAHLFESPLRQRIEGDVIEGRDDQIRVRGGQQLLIVGPRQAEGRHVARLRRLHAVLGILDHEVLCRREAKLLGCGQEDLGMWLALLEVSTADVRVQDVQEGVAGPDEVVAQAHVLGELVETDALQERVRVLGGGGRPYPQARVLDRQHEAQCVGVGVELAGLDQLDYHHLLAIAVLLGALLGVGHPEVLQHGLGARVARLAGHDPLVYLRGKFLGSV